MKITSTPLNGCFVIEPKVFSDERGLFFESFNEKTFLQNLGVDLRFVQDNHSESVKGALRGLHYQTQQVQGKLVRVVQGRIFDVAVDLRQSSPTFKKWFGIEVSADNYRQLWVPPGFAHGFLALSDRAQMVYKTTDYYHPSSEVCLRYDDPNFGVDWPQLDVPFLLSAKDRNGITLDTAPVFE